MTSLSGFQDIFISKSDGSGNFIWAKAMGGTSGDIGYSIAVDASGNSYSTGYFSGTADFNPDITVSDSLTSAGGPDIFISKMDSAGNLVWVKSIGGAGLDFGIYIALDDSGNVYTLGIFTGTIDFDPDTSSTFNLTSVAFGSFLTKFDSSGNFVWARRINGTINSYSQSIAFDPSGNIYLTGYFHGTTDLNPDTSATFTLTAMGNEDIFILKLDNGGNFIWAKSFGGTNYEHGFGITTDTSANIYTTGSFQGTVDFDPGMNVFPLTSSANYNAFISKLDSAGNFIWAKALDGTNSANSIAVDAGNNVYTIGSFQGTADFDPDVAATYPLTSNGFDDIFISKLDSSGSFVWAKTVGGAKNDYNQSATIDISGTMYLTGYFFSPILTFGSTTLTNTDSNGNSSDLFIAKLDYLVTGIENEKTDTRVSIYPNPASTHFTIGWQGNTKKVELYITDMAGNIIYSTATTETHKIVVSTKYFAAGVYVVRIQAGNFMETRKLVIAK